MKTIEDLKKLFQSEIFKEAASDYYARKERFLDDKWKDPELFIQYLKAAILDKYSKCDELEKEELLEELSYDAIEPELDINIISMMNTSVNDNNRDLNDEDKDFLLSLKEYIDNPLYEELSNHDEKITELIVKTNGFSFMKDIERDKKSNFGRREYVFDEEEINTLKKAKAASSILTEIHSKYDENVGYEKQVCNYDAIEDEKLKKYAYHTDKDNPEFEIIFDDGTIMNYYMGDIRFKPFNFETVLKLTKLSYISLFYNDNQNEIQKVLCPFDNSIDPYDMDSEDFEDNIFVAFTSVYCKLYGYDSLDSDNMVKNAKDQISKMNKLILKYNLSEE